MWMMFPWRLPACYVISATALKHAEVHSGFAWLQWQLWVLTQVTRCPSTLQASQPVRPPANAPGGLQENTPQLAQVAAAAAACQHQGRDVHCTQQTQIKSKHLKQPRLPIRLHGGKGLPAGFCCGRQPTFRVPSFRLWSGLRAISCLAMVRTSVFI